MRTDNLAGSQTLRTQQVPFPRQGRPANFNDRLILYFNADSGAQGFPAGQTNTLSTRVGAYESLWILPTTLEQPV